MASAQRNVTPSRCAPKVEIHEPPNRILPPDDRRDSNDVRSGARNYYESVDIEEHGHVLVSVVAPARKARKQVLQEERKELCDCRDALDERIPGEATVLCADALAIVCGHVEQIGNQEVSNVDHDGGQNVGCLLKDDTSRGRTRFGVNYARNMG